LVLDSPHPGIQGSQSILKHSFSPPEFLAGLLIAALTQLAR